LTGPSTYYYRVKAQDANNNYSVYSNTVSATIQAPVADTTAPTTPTNLSATVSGNQTSLSWSASTDSVGVSGYQILRSTTNGSGYTLVSTSNTTSYTDSSLPAATYYYVVKAYDAAGNTSANSNQATAQITTSNTSCTPITITNLTSSIGTSNPQNTASVTATSDSVMYLTVGLAFMPVSFPSDSISISGLGATWTKVSTNTFGYRRRVWLFKGVGGSGTGPVTINYNGINTSSLQEVGWVLDKVTGLDLTTPNDSVTTVETAGVSPSSLTVSTSQTPGTCDVTYSSLVLENQKTTNVESGWSSLGQTSTGSLGVRKVASAWDDARDTSHTWSWTDGSYAAAFMTILNSGVNVVPPTGDVTAPSVPSNLMANATSTLINLSWSASTDNVGVSQYLVERSNSATTRFTQVAAVSTNSYIDMGLIANTVYYYRVRAKDQAGNFSAYSNIVSVTTPASVVNPPTSSFSPWCSSLLGLVGSAVKSGVYNEVADINNDKKVNLSDLTAATNYYTANNDSACQARFINTYNSNNYLNIDWCSGILKGVQDRYSLASSTAYSSIFELNNDDAINLEDISLISEYTANNNQAACFAEYNLPLSTSKKPAQTITKLPSLTTNTVDANLVKKLNITKTEQSKLNLLKGRFATLSDGASAYINTKGQAIALYDASLMQTLAKQALGISKATLAKLQVSLNYNDSDNDGDQVPNVIEELIGTNLNNKDTDGDGYTDGVEIENWYSPTKNTPKARLDKNLAKRLSGRILIVVPTGALFYVNPNTYKLELLKNATLEQLNSLGVIKEVKGIKIRK
jgi:fibronectin type 3 domain-containing protein